MDDDSIVIDTRRNNTSKQIVLCVNFKVQLDYIEERTYKCNKCKYQYFLDVEILEYEDVFESAHQDENIELEGVTGNKPMILTADDNDFSSETDQEKKSGFYSMDYILGPGKKMVEYYEEENN